MEKITIAGSLLLLTSLSFAYADTMKDTGVMTAKDSMMDKTMMKNDMAKTKDMNMYDSVMPSSKKADITKLQMMLVEKGYLMMPKGVSYGYYGALTKAAFKKFSPSAMMMKTDNGAAMMNATDSMMKQ